MAVERRFAAATLEETLERAYVPLFGAVGIDAERAWRTAP